MGIPETKVNPILDKQVEYRKQKLSEIEINRKLFFTSFYTFISNVVNLNQLPSKNEKLVNSFNLMLKSFTILTDIIMDDSSFNKSLELNKTLNGNLKNTLNIFLKVKKFYENSNISNSVELYKDLIKGAREYFIFLKVINLENSDTLSNILELDIKIKKMAISFKVFFNDLTKIPSGGLYNFFRDLNQESYYNTNNEINEAFEALEQDYNNLFKFINSKDQQLKFLIFTHFKVNLNYLGSFIRLLKGTKDHIQENFTNNYTSFVGGKDNFCGFVIFYQLYIKEVNMNDQITVLINQVNQF